MKTIITISFLIALFLITQLSFAGGSFTVNVNPKAEGKALVEISNSAEQKYEISISDESGNLVYYHETEGDKKIINRTYDFSNLEYGIYKLKVKMDGASNEQSLSVSKKGVEVGEVVRKTDPIFSFKNDILNLSFLNHNQDEMSLNIYNNGTLIWNSQMQNIFALQKGFNLSKLRKGDYKVVFSSGDEIYEYALAKY